MKRLILVLPLFVASAAFGSAFTAGNLVVWQVGSNGNTVAINNNATATFLDEFTPAGSSVQQIAVPTINSGANLGMTLSASATSEGFLSRTPDGQYLVFGGYNSGVSTVNPNSVNASVTARVLARVDYTGAIDSSTSVTNAAITGNIRSVASDNGNRFWFGSSAQGLPHAGTYGIANTAVSVYGGGGSGPSNVRVTKIFNGQLYGDAASGSYQSVFTNGVGLPTTAAIAGVIPGGATTAGPSPYDYFFADANNDTVLDTLWIADDRAAASGGGIQKWLFGGSTWSLSYVLGTNASSTGFRGMTVDTSGANPIIYATTSESAGTTNRLVSIIDIGALSTVTTLATSGANNFYRGVSFTPTQIPEPAAILGLGLLMLIGSRKFFRRQR